MRRTCRLMLHWPLMLVISAQLLLGNVAYPHSAAVADVPESVQPAPTMQHDEHCAGADSEVASSDAHEADVSRAHDGHGSPCCKPNDCHCSLTVALVSAVDPVVRPAMRAVPARAALPAPPQPGPDRLLRPPATAFLA